MKLFFQKNVNKGVLTYFKDVFLAGRLKSCPAFFCGRTATLFLAEYFPEQFGNGDRYANSEDCSYDEEWRERDCSGVDRGVHDAGAAPDDEHLQEIYPVAVAGNGGENGCDDFSLFKQHCQKVEEGQ